jgi:hypothetical protein
MSLSSSTDQAAISLVNEKYATFASSIVKHEDENKQDADCQAKANNFNSIVSTKENMKNLIDEIETISKFA